MGADGKSAEIEVNPPLTIEPDTDNAGVGNFHSALRYSLAEFFYLEVKENEKEKSILVGGKCSYDCTCSGVGTCCKNDNS